MDCSAAGAYLRRYCEWEDCGDRYGTATVSEARPEPVIVAACSLFDGQRGV